MKTWLISFVIVITVAASAYAEPATVIVKENAIRESCKFFAPVKAMIHAGNVLEIVSQDGDWFQVKFNNVQGCVHKSVVQTKSVSLSKKLIGSEKQSASGEEVALAGKGFNPQVEAAYKSKNPKLNFQAVDAIGGYTVAENKVQEFIASGKLNTPK
jgi:hypothetical protein